MSVEGAVGAWTAGRHGDVPSLSVKVTRAEPQTLLFLGDLHLDNPKCDRPALRAVLDQAVERNAAIVLLGDVFDAMQGRSDKRSNKAALRAQYAGRDDYLTAILEDAAGFLLPYARHIWLVLDGNHENSIVKYNEVSLTRLLVHHLNTDGGGHAIAPGYQTYVMIKTSDTGAGAKLTPVWLTHGSGGSSPVTGGVIGAQRRAVNFPDAEFVMSGHLHSDWYKPFVQHRLSTKGRVYQVKQRHFQVGAWKQDFGHSGWAAEKGLPPGVASGWWAEVRRARGENPLPRHRWRFYEAEPE